MQNTPLIKCPVCGQEYMPAEIYLPEEFFGKPKNIVKDSSGQVKSFSGEDMNLDEEYICDQCNTKIKIHANVTFETDFNEESNEEYVRKFNKPKKIELPEVDLFK